MGKFLAMMCIERKEEYGLENAQNFYKKICKHRKYGRFKEPMDMELQVTGNEDIIVEIN